MKFAARPVLGAAVLALALGQLACSNPAEPVTWEPPPLPANDSPEGALQRLAAAYARMDLAEYQRLFTGDFTFEFSNLADPQLVQKYSAGWYLPDEMASTQRLFQGGANSDGMYLPKASSIDLSLTPVAPRLAPSEGLDPATHADVLAEVLLTLDVRETDTYYVVGETPTQSNRFYFVRGDAAIGLHEDQPADASHWYVYRWLDESPEITSSPETCPPFGTLQSEDSTWGGLKALYR